MRKRLFPVLLVVVMAACVSTSVVPLGAPIRAPAVPADEVQVFASEADVKVPYDKVAIIKAKGNHNKASEEKLVQAIRKRAGQLGANGVILGEFQEPSTGAKVAEYFLLMSADRTVQAVAIRLRPEAEP